MGLPVETTIDVNELESCFFRGTLLDQDGAPVTSAALTSLTMTLFNKSPDETINGRDRVDVKNTNNGTYGATDGVFRMNFQSADNPILDEDDDGVSERHYALFEASWGSGQAKRWMIAINVKRLRRVP